MCAVFPALRELESALMVPWQALRGMRALESVTLRMAEDEIALRPGDYVAMADAAALPSLARVVLRPPRSEHVTTMCAVPGTGAGGRTWSVRVSAAQ